MNKTTLNFATDTVAALLFLAMIVTGFILRFPLPPGTNKSLTLWTLTRHEWGTIHFWMSVALLISLFLHLVLHWQWVVTMVSKKLFGEVSSKRSYIKAALMTVSALVLVFTLFAWVAFREVDQINSPVICSSDDQLPVASAKNNQKIDFWKDIYPILEGNCLSCHGPQKTFGGFRADQRDNFFMTVQAVPLVVPGKSEESLLMKIISGKKVDMPMREVHTLSNDKVTLIKKWIDEGADWPSKSTVNK